MTTAADISWSCPSGTFNLRVAAVITRGDQVLLCTVEGPGLAAIRPDLGDTLRHVVLGRLDRGAV